MNVYYILGLILMLIMISTFAIVLVHAKVTYNPVKKQAGLVKKRETREQKFQKKIVEFES